MKRNIYLFSIILGTILFSAITEASAQVTVISRDSLNCTQPCTELVGILEGDNPTNAGITADDIYTAVIPIGFTFNFYGTNYTGCVIGANGNISFTASLAGAYDPYPVSAPLLGNTEVLNSICGPWCDIDIFYTGTPIGTETYSTDGVAPNRKFSVTWCNCSMFSCGAQRIITQVIIYEGSNNIEVHIAKHQICTGWYSGHAIVGVQNAAGTVATAAPGRDYPSTWTNPPTEAWRFTPATGGTSYTVASIAYAPIPYLSSALYWYNATTGAYIGSSDSINVCPSTPTLYKCGALGCSDTSWGYYLVTPTGSLTIATTSVNPTICGACNGSITISGLTAGRSDTVNYSYNGVPQPPYVAIASAGGTITLSGLCAGIYNPITVTQGTCTSLPVSDTLTNPAISMTGTSTNNSFCGVCDGTIVLSGLYASTGYTVTYDFNGVGASTSGVSNTSGILTLSGLCAGSYTNVIATISSSGGACVTPAIGPFTITPPPTPTLNVVSSSNPTQCGFCNGTITITSVTPSSTDTVFYSLNGAATTYAIVVAQPDSAIVLSGLCGGTYTGFSVTIGSCSYTVDGSATLVNPQLIPGFDTAIQFGCNGDAVSFTNTSFTTPAGGALYYIWTFGDGTTDTSVSPVHVYSAQGTYTVTLTVDNHSCDTTYSVVLPLVHPLVASFTMDTNLICQDKPITFTNTSIISDGYYGTFLWSFGNGATDTNKNATYTFLNTGTYTVQLIATDWIPCHDTTTAIVQVDTISGIQLNLTDTVICEGTYITFTALYSGVGNTGDVWNFGDGGIIDNVNPAVHSFDGTGVFTITVTANYRACPDTAASRTVRVFPQPTIYLGPDTSICAGSESLILTDNTNEGNPVASWIWSTGQTGPSITVVAPGYYYATVDVNNCYASDTILVQSNCYMDIPNAFTPNGDGINDFFFPRQMLTKGLATFSMNIYDRWGELIFQSTSLDGRGWDGKFNNVDQPEGVYVYVIDATFIDGQKEHHQGNVTLLR